MRANLTRAWTGQDAMPKVQEQIDFEQMDDEQVTAMLPGGGGAEAFLRSLQNGK